MTRFSRLAFGVALCAAPLITQSHAEPSVHRIVIAKMAFGASPENLRMGDVVEWANEDIFVHSATAADGSFDVDVQPKGVARVVIRTAGVIRYRCKYHPGMQGTLTVGSPPVSGSR